MTDAILDELRRLYPDGDTAESTYKALIARLDKPDGVSSEERFTQADAILITYGDTLQRDGQVPLRTLAGFAREHLTPLFSHIHLLPFYPYSSDDGFSVLDFYAVNPDLGDWADVERLAEDFDLMFDAVFNHMSAQSDWFQKFLAGEPGYENMFVTADPAADLSGVTRPRTSPLLTAFPRPDGDTVHVWTTFSADQVDINFADPDTLLKMLDVLLFYVEKGASIIRLDAIAYLWKQIGTSSIHLPQTHTAIRLMRAVLDVAAPSTMLITETNVPHEENVAYFGRGTNEAQMVYNFTLPPMLMHTMLAEDCTRLNEWVRTLETPSPQTTFFNFTASHDGIGMRPVEGLLSDDDVQAMIDRATATGGRVSYKTNEDGSSSPYELNVSYVDAVTDPDAAPDVRAKQFLLTQAIAMSLAGVPAVYIHSLLGSRNDIRGMQAVDRARLINRAKLDADTVEDQLADADTFRAQVFDGYRRLLVTRRDHVAFHPNSTQTVEDLKNRQVFALRRTSDNGDSILALHNVSGREQPVSLPVDYRGSRDLLTSDVVEGETVSLSPYGVRWLHRA